jgi:hypothetical protein
MFEITDEIGGDGVFPRFCNSMSRRVEGCLSINLRSEEERAF